MSHIEKGLPASTCEAHAYALRTLDLDRCQKSDRGQRCQGSLEAEQVNVKLSLQTEASADCPARVATRGQGGELLLQRNSHTPSNLVALLPKACRLLVFQLVNQLTGLLMAGGFGALQGREQLRATVHSPAVQ